MLIATNKCAHLPPAVLADVCLFVAESRQIQHINIMFNPQTNILQ